MDLSKSGWPWMAFAVGLTAVYELVAFAVQRSEVPTSRDWQHVETFLAEEVDGHRDLVVVAPRWADPVLRTHSGELLSLAAAGRSDLAPFERVWEVSINGHRSDDLLALGGGTLVNQSGALRVRRYELGATSVAIDLLDRFRDARISAGDEMCDAPANAHANGGLGTGPMPSRQSKQCRRGEWNWVGPTVISDLDLQPRRCIYQHPIGDQPVTTSIPSVRLSERLVFYNGLYYEHERALEGAAVTMVVRFNGQEIGRDMHRDGDGWKRFEIDTRSLSGQTSELAVEVTAAHIDRRSFCWAGTVRGPARERAE